MKRCIVTVLGAGEKPLFDLVVYGVTKDEFILDAESSTRLLDQRLRRRNMALDDFEGVLVTDPAELPRSDTTHEYTDQRIERAGF